MIAPASSASLAAAAWAEVCDALDLQLSPLGLDAIAALGPRRGETIVDVGCGAGQTVLQLAEAVGPEGRVVGADVAAPLLAIARTRARGLAQASFVEGDAAALALPGGSLDAVFSRFGVMAFPDPVAAFSHLRRLLKPAGRLAFVCWRPLDENELDHLPLRAAALPRPVDATPFSFADPARTRAVLEAAGFGGVSIAARDREVSSGGLDAMAAVLLKVGPLGRILREDPTLRAGAEPAVRAALAARGDDTGRVALRATTWVVTAQAPAA